MKMTTITIIEIVEFKLLKGNNWISFKAFVGRFDRHNKYVIDFCGTEMQTTIPLTDSEEDALRTMLVKDFGYSPYNKDNVSKQISQKNIYEITR